MKTVKKTTKETKKVSAKSKKGNEKKRPTEIF